IKGRIVTDDLIVSHQGAISAKLTEHGDLIVEQYHDDPQCADQVHAIIVRAENAEQFINELAFTCLGKPAPRIDAPPTVPTSPQRPTKSRTGTTNAERQRRYRERKRKPEAAE